MAKRKVSCLACRAKKVKCDGEKPCQRCQIRQTSCVYQKPGAVGRPPKNAVMNKLVLSKLQSSTAIATRSSICREFIFQNLTTTPIMAPILYLHDSQNHNLDHYINTLFSTYFSRQASLDGFIKKKKGQLQLTSKRDYSTVNPRIHIDNLIHFFVYMSADISNILVQRISRLKLLYYVRPDFSATALAYDHTESFFETPTENSLMINPLNSLPPQQAVRLIEHFFCIHPYSILFNKTLLLQSYWTDTADPVLLSVVYGTTIFISPISEGKPLELWNALNTNKRNPFLEYAHILLAKATAEATPSRYQALVLLATFEVTFGFPKRGMTLFGTSCLLAVRLGLFDNTMSPGLSGIEKELLSMTFWAALESIVRGCAELDRIPRAAIMCHNHPLPPSKIHMSKSYQLDVESDNPRPLESYRYLIETFYIKSVIARFSCKIALALPNEFSGEPTKAPDIIKKHFKIPKDAPLVESVESSLQKILDEFKEFNQQNCHNWSPLQIYTLDLSYLFYRICITFVHSNTLSQNDHRHTFILYDLHSLKPLDLTNVKNILDINKVLPESFEVIDKSLVYLRNFDVHSEQSDFLSRGIVISSIDAAAQVLMYSYQVAPTDKVRHYLELAETILTMPVIWFKWETAEIIKNSITEFLTMHPPLTLNDNALLSLNSFSPMSSSATSSDFNDTPWFTNEGNWVQDLNSIFTFHDLNVPMQLFQSEEQTSLSEQDLSAILTDLL